MTRILSGVDALARLLVLREQLDRADGLNTATMVSGYPGSPLGTFDLVLDGLGAELAAHRIHHRPGLNEELAAATVWGSQMGGSIEYSAGTDGVAGAWYGKTPGLDRSGDVLKHANAMGTGPNGGAVLFCGDDPGAKSSTLNCDSQHAFEDACVPVLYPADQQEVVDLGVHAFRLSRFAGCWVGLKMVTAVSDGIGSVDLEPARHHPSEPTDLVVDGSPWIHRPLATLGPHAVPGQEALVVDHRLQAARAYVRHNGLDRIIGADPGASVGIVCAGKTTFDVIQALADLGLTTDYLPAAGIRILKLAMTYPLVEETVRGFAASVDEVIVIEEKRPFIETQVRSILHEAGSTVPVVGKRGRDGSVLVPVTGELDPGSVAEVLARAVPSLIRPSAPGPAAARTLLPLLEIPGRAPGYCSGCPHNRSTVAPEGALVGGGVGCHGIMYFEARNAGMKRLPPTPMGAEGVPWLGLAPFVDEPHLIQNIGDGTLSHSGTLAIRASVAAGVDVTFKILYNAAVAMTGGQDVTGLLDVPSLTRSLEAEGVCRVVVCAEDPKRYGRRARWAKGVEVRGRDALNEVQDQLRSVPGVTVIIYDQQCAAEARRLRKRGDQVEPPRRVIINEAVCEGCGDCSTKSNCLSVQPVDTEFGEKREIHDPSCNRDYTCLEGDCPSFVTIAPKPGRTGAQSAGGAAPATPPNLPALPDGLLPDPPLVAFDRQYGIYFTGIGGTGVVTANRVIATAAEASGLVVEGMDQTGLSQKAGAVVSHLHLARDRTVLGSAAVGPEGADLYLSGDILQAAGPAHLAKVRPGQTIAVIGAGVTPTSAMLQTRSAGPDQAALQAAIVERVGADRVAFIDARRIADTVFANHLLANIVLLGAAYQLGGLPVPLAAIDAAQRGAASREAFTWGRWAVHAPDEVEQRLQALEGAATTAGIWDPSAEALAAGTELVVARHLAPELRTLLSRRAAQVIDYQDAALAGRFLDLVEAVAATDDADRGWALTTAAASSWFKLLTYKDEYEVARLHRRIDYGAVARDLGIEGDYTVTYQLHPPVLRRLGRKTKLPMGAPYAASFRVLARMKRLRGTKLDLFGLDRDRRAERALIEEYASLVPHLTGTTGLRYGTRVELAASAQSIKGYATVKDRAIEQWRVRVQELLAAAAADDPAVTPAASPVP